MAAAPADILPIFQEKKKGIKEGQMHESSFEKLSQKPCPVTAARDGSHLAARESEKEIILAGHIASLNKIWVPSLRRTCEMAVGKAISCVCHEAHLN